MADDTPAAPGPAARARIRGVDAARAVAILGMVAIHVQPPETGAGLAATLYRLPYGKASVLFAVLAGVGVSLLAGDRSPARRRSTRRRLAVRAAILFPLGLALQELSHGIAVILQYHAVYFLFAAAAIVLADRALLGTALALTVLSPVLLVVLRMATPGLFEGGEWVVTNPDGLLAALFLVGYYPAVTWVPPVLFGMWVGRRDLRAAAVRWRLVGGGAVVAAVAYGGSALATARWGTVGEADPSWRALLLSGGHTEMPPSIVGASAAAVAVLGAALLLCDRLPRLTWPAVALGQLALTVYVAHLFVLDRAEGVLRRDTIGGAVTAIAVFAVVTAAGAVAWRAAFARGPLEALLHPRGRRPRARAPRPPADQPVGTA